MEKIKMASVKASGKTLGLLLLGFIGSYGVSKAVKKDNWKVNGIATAIAFLLHSWILKKESHKDIAAGATLLFAIKSLNNVTTEVVSGMEGIPDGVKNIISKYVPKLSGTDDDDAEFQGITDAEAQILLGYTEGMGMRWNNQAQAKKLPSGNAMQHLLCRPQMSGFGNINANLI
jgi:hypothetical protein